MKVLISRPIRFLGLLIIICATLFLLLGKMVNKQNDFSLNEESGAYEALKYFGFSRTYPHVRLPEKAHYAAWENGQKKQIGQKNFPGSQWEPIGPDNFSGRTLKLAFNPQNPSTIYAGSASGGLWRSKTAGKGLHAWEYVPTGFPVLAVSSIAFPYQDSLTMYIGTGEVYNVNEAGTGATYRNARGSYGIGILKSNDGGNTWSKSLDWSYNQNHGIWDIDISMQDQDLIYAATTDGVYQSSDAGNIWTNLLDIPMVNSILIHPENDQIILAGAGNFNSPGKGIYRSDDGGRSWSKISSNLPATFNGKIQLEQAPSEPEIVYASIGNGFGFEDGATWTCKSVDFGINWEVISTTDYSLWQGWFAHDIAVSPADPDLIVTAGINVWKRSPSDTGLLRISSGGVGFSNPTIAGPDGHPGYVHSDIHDVLFHPENPDIFFIASDGGVHVSEDGGETFASRNSGYRTVQFYNGTSVSAQNDQFFIGGLQDNGTIAYSGSGRWTRIAGGDGSWSHIHPQNDQDIIVSSQFLRMRRTKDGGNNFDLIEPPVQNEFTAFIAPFTVTDDRGQRIYAGRNKIYRSSSRGDNWTPTNANKNLDGFNPINCIAVSPQNPDIVYAASAPSKLFGGTRGQVFVTRNAGDTWNLITGNLPDRYPTEIVVDPFNEAVVYISFSGYGSGHLFKTSNYGQSWVDISGNLPDVPINTIAVEPNSSKVVYIGSDLGVFYSVDGGRTWSPFNEGLNEAVMVFDLVAAPGSNTIFLASHGNGAYSRERVEIPLIFDAAIPFAMKIYPNPAVSQFTIDYKLSKDEVISGRLFDITGRIVLQFLDREQFAGEHTEIVDVSGFPMGHYVVQLSTPDQNISKRILVIRY